MTRKAIPGSREVELMVEALDEESADQEAAQEAVARLGIDVTAMAARIQANLAARKAADRRARYAAAQDAYTQEVMELATRRPEPIRPRLEQEAIFLSLAERAGPGEVAANFQKYEDANDEELAAMISALRYLLDKRDGSE